MAKSKYEYVKEFENYQTMLPNTYVVVRVDGKGFHKFTKFYDFEKPNDMRGIQLMNLSADIVMRTFTDIILAYGQSDEYSFLFDKDSQLYNRRSDKIATCVCSTFTAAYTFHFEEMLGRKLQMPALPVFDSRCVLYPTIENVKDYFSWRQVDCHINNLYNTTFWGLVKQGKNKQEVEAILSKTNAGGKNEILFTELGINYNNEPEIFKKGTALIRVVSEMVQEGIIVNQESEQQKQNKKDRKKVKKRILGDQQYIQKQMIFTKSIKNLKETRKQNEVDKLIITPAVINKPTNKLIVLRSPEKIPTTELKIQVTPVVRKAIRKTIVLPPHREERPPQAQYPIFVRYVNEVTTKKDFQDLINDAALQSVYIATKEATLTFMTQEAADKAVELINKTKLHGNQLRAVPNYKVNRELPEVRVQQKPSIFDRIQK